MDFSKHSNGTTSVKVHHAPGGKSNFSLAWDTTTQPNKPTQQPITHQPITQQQPLKEVKQPATQAPTNPPAAGKTSVKVHNPPGGKSNIIFG